MDIQGDPWPDRLQPPLGHGAGSYALGDARDLGAPEGTPAAALPALRDGGVPPTSRLRGLGRQAVLDPVEQGGGSWLDVQLDPYK